MEMNETPSAYYYPVYTAFNELSDNSSLLDTHKKSSDKSFFFLSAKSDSSHGSAIRTSKKESRVQVVGIFLLDRNEELVKSRI